LSLAVCEQKVCDWFFKVSRYHELTQVSRNFAAFSAQSFCCGDCPAKTPNGSFDIFN